MSDELQTMNMVKTVAKMPESVSVLTISCSQQILLRFCLGEDNMDRFAGYAAEFSEKVEQALYESGQFSNVKMVILGAGKNERGISYVSNQ